MAGACIYCSLTIHLLTERQEYLTQPNPIGSDKGAIEVMSNTSFTIQDLVALASNELPSEQHSAIEAWAAGQPEMAKALNQLRNVIDSMRRDDSEDMSSEAIQKAFDIFTITETVTEATTKSPTLIEQLLAKAGSVIAEMVFDSRVAPAMAGFRRSASRNYQLAYECEAGRIDMQITPVSDMGKKTCRIRGQVTCEGDTGMSGATVIKLHNTETDEVLGDVSPDEHGQFRMDTLPGVYNLVVEINSNAGAIIAQEVPIE